MKVMGKTPGRVNKNPYTMEMRLLSGNKNPSLAAFQHFL
jgi:hypothetical protein